MDFEPPGGTIKLSDKFYIERETDPVFKEDILRPGTMITIRGPHLIGKSSLLIRGLHQAENSGAKVILFDLQDLHSKYLDSLDKFLYSLAEFIIRKLQVDLDIQDLWQQQMLPSGSKLTYLLEDYIFPRIGAPIILAIDEADRLLKTIYSSDFFSMIRGWYNRRALGNGWDKFSIVIVMTVDSALTIPEPHKSPFNVGHRLFLEDFNEEQVRDLNQRYGLPLDESKIVELMDLLNGHPYLTQVAFFNLVTRHVMWDDFIDTIATDQGPYGGHLRNIFHWLLDEPDLLKAFKQIVHNQVCKDERAILQLIRFGLIKPERGSYICRYNLYKAYFEKKLQRESYFKKWLGLTSKLNILGQNQKTSETDSKISNSPEVAQLEPKPEQLNENKPKAETNSNQDQIKELIKTHRQRLHPLKLRQARQGHNTPPEVVNEIKDIEAEIETLKSELA